VLGGAKGYAILLLGGAIPRIVGSSNQEDWHLGNPRWWSPVSGVALGCTQCRAMYAVFFVFPSHYND